MNARAPRRLEIAADSLGSALAAQEAGADRVELCEGLSSGGTTPSYGTLALAREHVRIPLFVLVRPRAGDFLYDARETEVMLRDIEMCVRLGCDGVVIGALQADGGIDLPLCERLVAAAGPLQVTFHRAFDAARDQAQALEQVIALGCQRVLTSGGQATAVDGADRIAALVTQAAGRVTVMPGAGIDAGNVAALATLTGACEFHASAKAPRVSSMGFRGPALHGLAPDWSETDPARVRALRAALDAMGRP
ncbi:copper homeostasis protein CutC [Pseudoxanthomonas sp. SE1]|uniref:copper homeostasis protein CutC n=1 Tax=Pseudoxanthomonas sp. SE1 TaxID=1664560 RepID=UPI00240D7DF7|nr:copper homeostasis protein CutC [Pseudoxanthomonas sp. SE1]WFC41566.1 copper homeostasis protein CutC [Pseudoxanthomonas sp. SE1]